jgi:hypothetical protein
VLYPNNKEKKMADAPVNRSASNYHGKGGKTNVQMQGQTDSGGYGSDIMIERRLPHPPTDVRP